MKQILFLLSSFGVAPLALLAAENISEPAMSNPRTAFNGESTAHAPMEANAEVLRTFRFARAAEVEHARLYREALQDLEGMKDSQTFYVCPARRFTTRNPDSEPCPTCATPKENFEQVN